MQQYDADVLAAIPNGDDNPRFATVQAMLAHDLIGGAQRAELPPLYSTDGQGDAALVRFKCFTPWTNWTWYATEFDGTSVCFGLVEGHEVEFGNFDLGELQSLRGRLGLRIERDLHWSPISLGELRKQI